MRNKLKLICILFTLSVNIFAQRYKLPEDTLQKYQSNAAAVGMPLNTWLPASELYQLTRGIPVTSTGTTSVTGNWLRGDSATAQQNRLRTSQYYGSSSTAEILGNINQNTSNRAFWYRQDSSTTQQNKLLQSQYFAGKYTANWLQGISSQLTSGTLTVAVSGTPTVAVTNTVTVATHSVNVANFPATQTVAVSGTPTVAVTNTVTTSPTNNPQCSTCSYITFTGFYNTDGSTLYTVTGGKTFYLTGYDVEIINFSTTNNVQITIKDNATAKITLYAGKYAAAATEYRHVVKTMNMEANPMPFTNTVKMGYSLGANTDGSFYGTFYGYEK